MTDPWEDEGYPGEDDWESSESLESDVEDDGGLDELEEPEEPGEDD